MRRVPESNLVHMSEEAMRAVCEGLLRDINVLEKRWRREENGGGDAKGMCGDGPGGSRGMQHDSTDDQRRGCDGT